MKEPIALLCILTRHISESVSITYYLNKYMLYKHVMCYFWIFNHTT